MLFYGGYRRGIFYAVGDFGTMRGYRGDIHFQSIFRTDPKTGDDTFQLAC